MKQVYQCSGITQKGERCRRTVRIEHGFCSYHVSQASTLSRHDDHRKLPNPNSKKSKYHDQYRQCERMNGQHTPQEQPTIPGQFQSFESKMDAQSLSASRHAEANMSRMHFGNPRQLPHPRGYNFDTFTDYKPISDKSRGRGYIYIYTMQSFLQPPKGWTFKVKNIPNTSTRNRDKWINFKSRSSPYILVKIGMTTQLPNVRIKQWENKCKHELVNLGPQNEHLIKSRLHWWQKFLCLSIDDDGDTEMRLSRFKKDGFYCEENVNTVESMIHQQMRKKYGKGDVYCSGCISDEALTRNKNKEKVPLQNNYNVHVEWFLIPKQDLRDVYRLIDQTCRSIG
ncbi:hypothetical protein CANMA_005121 [Candida margitis]|uniref:uncharacterized protein n=1 Tax=Candida margitis TaxID=1775924 RepID=UPI00222674D8|nr:uncharacterized protein CANMA_005121 [Candida margitis]KAI5952042.1 hypothetical protein CANMA_005121 [Candida margitis]